MVQDPDIVPTEYRLFVTRHAGDPLHDDTVVFRLETVRTFANFQYELKVQTARSADTLAFTVLGLQPPLLSLPSSGPASFECEIEGLTGTQSVTVKALDGKVNTFQLSLSPAVRVKRKPAHAFIHVITDQNPDPTIEET